MIHSRRVPRAIAFAGFAIAISGIAAELAIDPTPPARFPNWYIVPFWYVATWATFVICMVAAFRPTPHLTRLGVVFAIVWCLGRASLNFYSRFGALPTGATATGYVTASIPGLLFLGLAIMMGSVGIATARSDGRQVAGPP